MAQLQIETMYTGRVNSPAATLTSNIGAGDTVIPVSAVSVFPDAPNLAVIGTEDDAETILYAAKTETALSGCTRAFEGTAKAWPQDTPIARNFTHYDYNALRQNIVKIAAHAQSLAPLDSPTFTGTVTGITKEMVGLGQVDNTSDLNKPVSKAQQAAFDALNIASIGGSNPNLLDNWYFPDPIDQRQGKLVPSGTPYRKATGSSFDDTLAHFSPFNGIAGDEFEVLLYSPTGPNHYPIGYVSGDTALVPGYVGNNAYAIDRWRLYNHPVCFLENDGVRFTLSPSTNGARWRNFFSQWLESPAEFSGREMTLSFLIASGGSGTVVATFYDSTGHGSQEFSVLSGGLLSVTHTPDDAGLIRVSLHDATGDGVDVKIIAAKLELGGVQTLARQTQDGRWVLSDPPPNKATELLKCQRHQICVIPHKLSPIGGTVIAQNESAAIINLPLPTPLRINPSLIRRNIAVVSNTNGNIYYPVTWASLARITGNVVRLNLECDGGGLEAGKIYMLSSPPNATGRLILDANL